MSINVLTQQHKSYYQLNSLELLLHSGCGCVTLLWYVPSCPIWKRGIWEEGLEAISCQYLILILKHCNVIIPRFTTVEIISSAIYTSFPFTTYSMHAVQKVGSPALLCSAIDGLLPLLHPLLQCHGRTPLTTPTDHILALPWSELSLARYPASSHCSREEVISEMAGRDPVSLT